MVFAKIGINFIICQLHVANIKWRRMILATLTIKQAQITFFHLPVIGVSGKLRNFAAVLKLAIIHLKYIIKNGKV